MSAWTPRQSRCCRTHSPRWDGQHPRVGAGDTETGTGPHHPPSQAQPYSSTRRQTFMEWSVTGMKRTKRAMRGGSRSLRTMS